MGAFKIPDGVCDDIEKLANRFWWKSSGNNESGIIWQNWAKLTIPKSCGGMGFRDLKLFNLALLAKQSWRLMTDPQSLVARLLKARYYPSTDILGASLGHNPSYTWRSIFQGIEVMRKGIVRKIGSGLSVNIWEDPWLADWENMKIQSPCPANCQLKWVSDLVQEDGLWNWQLIESIFNQRDRNLIVGIPRPSSSSEDKWIWHPDTKGGYTIKSGYKTLCSDVNFSNAAYPSFKWSLIWSQCVPAKVKSCMWRFLTDCIPTTDRLITIRVSFSPICKVCNLNTETPIHTIMHCKFAMDCWEMFPGSLVQTQSTSLFEWLSGLSSTKSKDELELICMVW